MDSGIKSGNVILVGDENILGTEVRTKSWTGYAKRPNLCLYSRGLTPPKDSLIRLLLYQLI